MSAKSNYPMKRLILSIMSILFFSNFILAQSASSSRKSKFVRSIFLDAGVGRAVNKRAIQTSLNVELRKRFMISYNLDAMNYLNRDTGQLHDFITYALLFGQVRKTAFSLIHYSAGPAYIDAKRYELGGQYNGGYETMGLKAKIGLNLSYWSIGFGISPYIIANTYEMYGGLTVNIAFGWVNVREK